LATTADHLDGVMGYAIKDLSTGETFLRLPDTVFPQASSIKLTVLLELMRQAQVGSGSNRQPFIFYCSAAALYLAIAMVTGALFRRAERRSLRGVRTA